MESADRVYQVSSLKEGQETPGRIRNSSPATLRRERDGSGPKQQVVILNELSEKLDGYFSLPSIGSRK